MSFAQHSKSGDADARDVRQARHTNDDNAARGREQRPRGRSADAG
jgi:hypothetical protein